ncbi:Nucleotidyl transferase [Gracilibacillus halophilus YIM-C55.5]|uniref:Nucleotidyl transferase n=1 Tax=Gracilibacillus halophilus YIM-C55.5 TaxID=1308866 RepID=N4WYK2_9BACI|nr:sugar phosphate nucleotidyltransferase [Gracilibacillus halophilus]ENH98111.1 Nucleotidyl transferase [Gracilibacillus halophilus YIM-C55.5]
MEVKQFMIDEENTLVEAMSQLDKVAKKVLFVSRNGALVAAITDGDIRRWILNKGDLDATVQNIANYEPKYLFEQYKHLAKKKMKEFSIEAIPIVTEEKHLVSVITWTDEIANKPKIDTPVVMMAGGFGTRLYPYTRILPKPLIPIGDVPIAEHIINRFNKAGVSEFHLIVNHKKNMIKSYFNEIDKNYHISYADEEQPLGTGGGLSLLKGKVNTTFFLTNCDILIEEEYHKIYDFHKEKGNLITMVCSLKNVSIPYGVVEVGDDGEIEAMKEKPEFSFFTNTGMYVVEPIIIEELTENTSIGFPDIIKKYQEKGEKVGVYPISEHSWMDMGQHNELEKMRKRLEDNES